MIIEQQMRHFDDGYYCYHDWDEEIFKVRAGFVEYARQAGGAEGDNGEIYYEDYILHPNLNVLKSILNTLKTNRSIYRRKIERKIAERNAKKGFRLADVATISGLSRC